MHNIQLFITILLFKSTLISCDFQSPPHDITDEKAKVERQTKFPPCKSCTMFVESFKKAMAKTERGKHGGGDAEWEEKKLGSYKTSEVRLTEIQEILCTDIHRGEQQCHSIAEEYENEIEEWWKLQDDHPDFYTWFCINTMKVCCPIATYGKDCTPCSSCNGNGVCAGNGTRKGNGKCKCDNGYSGADCESCADGFYESFRDESKLLCSPCHISCDGKCSGPGNKNCEKCAEGWIAGEGTGCLDINECADKKSCPSKSTFCVNNEGSFSCLDCDRSCASCDGDGPDMCMECAEGYELRDGMCTDLTNEKRDQYVNFTRYCLYFGLCITVCIIFQNSTWLAAIFGIIVGVYISISEYWLKTNPVPKPPMQKLFESAMNVH